MSRLVQLGDAKVPYPSANLQDLVDSKAVWELGDVITLRQRLQDDGYLFVRDAIPRADVLKARQVVIDHLARRGNVLVPETVNDGVLYERCMAGCVPFMEGKNELTHHPDVLNVIAGDSLNRLMAAVLDSPATTFDFKWLRAAWNSFFTGAHVDRVYMGRGSNNVITTWVPFDDATIELGALAVLQGSHRLPGFDRLQSTYGDLDVERDNFEGTGWFGTNPLELSAMDPSAQWRVTDYRAGDIIMFGMRTVHMSTVNVTNRVRISCDVRWQPEADPRDDRYFGAVDEKVKDRQKAGAWAADGKDTGNAEAVIAPKRTMPDMRALWGL